MDPTALSLVPPLVAIVLAFWTRQVLPALFFAIVTGGLVQWSRTGDPSSANVVARYLLPSIGSAGFGKILLIYLWSLGGLVGLWSRTGGAAHFARVVGEKVAKGPRSALLFTWILGVVFHQGGTVSTVLAGTTARPVADRHKVSHEELSFVVDATASPVATVLPFNAWPAYVATLLVGTVPQITDEATGVGQFLAAIPFNFYAIFAVLGTLLFSLDLLPWVGRRMSAARARARSTGALDAPGARPMLGGDAPDAPPVAKGYTPSLLDFLVPLGVLVTLAVVPFALGQAGVIQNGDWINEAFLGATLSAILLALAKGMRLHVAMDAFLDGCRSMTIGAVVLGLAVTLGAVTKDLGTAGYVVGALGDSVPVLVLPAALTVLCMGTSFATGTSWGTYAVVLPVAMPLAWALAPDPTYLSICLGAVLGGAVFGDQCSPISDTTILSSMFTGCDLMDHTHSQWPLALLFAGFATVASVVATAVLVA